MTDNPRANPYRAPIAAVEPLTTARGYTVIGATGACSLMGAIAGVASGIVMASLDLLGFNATAIMLAPGGAFGVAVLIAIDRCIASVAVGKRILLVPGCLAGFGMIGALLELTAIEPAFAALPPPWNRCASYLASTAPGFLFITALVYWVTHIFRWKNHLALWFVGTGVGFVAILVVMEYTRAMGRASLLILMANTAVQAIVLGAIGWQLASVQIAQSTPQQT